MSAVAPVVEGVAARVCPTASLAAGLGAAVPGAPAEVQDEKAWEQVAGEQMGWEVAAMGVCTEVALEVTKAVSEATTAHSVGTVGEPRIVESVVVGALVEVAVVVAVTVVEGEEVVQMAEVEMEEDLMVVALEGAADAEEHLQGLRVASKEEGMTVRGADGGGRCGCG